jgi:hypothetical protein
MNRSVWRFLLAWLLLAALPIKGFAATSMLACGQNHHQMVGAFAQDGGPASSRSHGHGDGVSHQHSVEQTLEFDSGQSSLSSDDAPSVNQAPYLNAKLKCSTCAPCCAGAALASNVSIHFVTAASGADFPALVPVYPSAPVSRLDRPPRIILA